MKQQHLLFMAMAILVLYSLIFPNEELIQNRSSNDTTKVAIVSNEQNQKVLSKVDEIKTKLMQTETCVRTRLELPSNFFTQVEDHNLIFSTIAFNIPRIDFGMGALQI